MHQSYHQSRHFRTDLTTTTTHALAHTHETSRVLTKQWKRTTFWHLLLTLFPTIVYLYHPISVSRLLFSCFQPWHHHCNAWLHLAPVPSRNATGLSPFFTIESELFLDASSPSVTTCFVAHSKLIFGALCSVLDCFSGVRRQARARC